jgi:hypothetical protein
MAMESRQVKRIMLLFILCLGNTSVSLGAVSLPSDENISKEQNDSVVMQAFTKTEVKDSDIVSIEDKTKRLIMFFMGVPLLLLLITTVSLGVAMGVYGKQVFIAHMVFAGLSMTLALAHAVVGLVWFYPF